MKRILIALDTDLGGTPLNALDLVDVIRARGYQVHVLATHDAAPGPIADMIRGRNLELTLVRAAGRRVTLYRPHVAQALVSVVRAQGINLVHAYGSFLIMDAFYGPHVRLGTPLVGTEYAMEISTWFPRHPPLVVGTRTLAEQATAYGLTAVLVEPPANTDLDAPGAVDARQFRQAHPGEPLYVIVSRLHPVMKQEGIERAIDAMRTLPGRLVVVGDGPARPALAARAGRLNAEVQREAVVMCGMLADPRPAYAAADVVLGMGSSALRAMAFAKPLVVLGVDGFSLECTPETASHFFQEGFWGVGDGHPDPLVEQIRTVLARRHELGSWGRELVRERYSLEAAASTLEGLYEAANLVSRTVVARSAARTAIHKVTADLMPERARKAMRPLVRRVLRIAG